MNRFSNAPSTAKVVALVKSVPANVYAMLLLFALLGFLCGPRFLTLQNFLNIVEQCAILSIISVGSLLAILSRGIDLSMGATMSFSGVVAAQLITGAGWPVIPAMLMGVVVGICIGIFNGLIISRTTIDPFIITLGSMNITFSLALIASKGITVSANVPMFRFLGGEYFAEIIPYSVIIALLIYVIFNVITKRTRLGTYIYAVGGNEVSAALTGINVSQIKFQVYALSGLLAAIAGVLLASRLGSANPGQGGGYEFYGIAAAVVGGASMNGGRGTVWKTLAGTFIISTLRNGLNMMGLPVSLQLIFLGLIIIGAVTVDTMSRRGN